MTYLHFDFILIRPSASIELRTFIAFTKYYIFRIPFLLPWRSIVFRVPFRVIEIIFGHVEGEIYFTFCQRQRSNYNARKLNYSACRRRDGVLKCPRFCLFFFVFFFGVESWAAAHGLYRCTEYRLLSEPMSTRLLNSISSRICRQNTQFNMYTTTSKQQEGCTFKDSHPKCFITTNFDKFHREAFARGGESR